MIGPASNPEGGGWPPWATEEVQQVPPDPGWSDRGRQLARELDALLAPWLLAGVEHIGSTAVPGLAAKPVLDLMAAVADPTTVVRDGFERLRGAGWVLVPPELDRRPWRRFLVAPDAEGRRRVAHLHILRPDEPRWTQQLTFRDLLRANADLRRSYAELKAGLATRHPRDRERYTEAKAEFIRAALFFPRHSGPRHSDEP